MMNVSFDYLQELLKKEGRVVVCCETKDREVDLRENLSRLGYTWFSGDDLCDHSFWHVHRERTCFTIYSLGKFVTFDDYSDVSDSNVYSYIGSNQYEPHRELFRTWELFELMDRSFNEVEGKTYRLVDGASKDSVINHGDIIRVGQDSNGSEALFFGNDKVNTFTNLEQWESVDFEVVEFIDMLEIIREGDACDYYLMFVYVGHKAHGGRFELQGRLGEILTDMTVPYTDVGMSSMILEGSWYIEYRPEI